MASYRNPLRYNVKRRLNKQPPVSEEQFESMLNEHESEVRAVLATQHAAQRPALYVGATVHTCSVAASSADSWAHIPPQVSGSRTHVYLPPPHAYLPHAIAPRAWCVLSQVSSISGSSSSESDLGELDEEEGPGGGSRQRNKGALSSVPPQAMFTGPGARLRGGSQGAK